MALLQNFILTPLLHLRWYNKHIPNRHFLINALQRRSALAFSRLAGAGGAASTGRGRVVVRNRDFSDSEHIGWIDSDVGLSKVFRACAELRTTRGGSFIHSVCMALLAIS
jgi:hypothetical protein